MVLDDVWLELLFVAVAKLCQKVQDIMIPQTARAQALFLAMAISGIATLKLHLLLHLTSYLKFQMIYLIEKMQSRLCGFPGFWGSIHPSWHVCPADRPVQHTKCSVKHAN